MNSDKGKIYALSLSFLAVLLSCFFIPTKTPEYLIVPVLIIFAPIVWVLIKKRSILSINKRQVLLLMLVIALLYITIYYLSGMKFGFYRNYFYFGDFLKELAIMLVVVFSTEALRRVFTSQKNKLAFCVIFLALVMVDVLSEYNFYSLKNFNRFMDFMGLCLFPSIVKNALFFYIASRYGFLPNVAYRLIVAVVPMIIPYAPAVPDALLSFANIVVPLIVYAFIKVLYEKRRREKRLNKGISIAITCILVAIMTGVIMVVSCQFRFCAIVIATESMTGEINKGDVVVYERYENQDLTEGQVIVFDYNGATTVHRVVKKEIINGQFRYYTKGDFNQDVDSGFITKGDVHGVVLFKVAYAGYPTLWLRSIFK